MRITIRNDDRAWFLLPRGLSLRHGTAFLGTPGPVVRKSRWIVISLAFEAIEQQIAAIKAQLEPQPDQPPRARPPRAANRGNLPKDLPRVEKLVDLADKSCPCCRREMVCIGEDRAERLDVVPEE